MAGERIRLIANDDLCRLEEDARPIGLDNRRFQGRGLELARDGQFELVLSVCASRYDARIAAGELFMMESTAWPVISFACVNLHPTCVALYSAAVIGSSGCRCAGRQGL